MTTPIPDADQLLKLLSWRQRRKVAKRLIITSCDLTYSGYLKHRQGTCEAHGRSSGPLPQVEHITTDPDCVQHRPPRTRIERWRFDRGRGRSCPVCHPWPQQMGQP